MEADIQVCGESRYEIADGADLGGSSKYSNITSEDQGGRGSMWTIFGHGLADLKIQERSAHISFADDCERGWRKTSSADVWL